MERRESISTPSVAERIAVLKEHISRSILYKGEYTTLLEMRRLYPGYFRSVPGFKSYRMRLVTARDLWEVENILKEIPEELSELPFHQVP
jgi:tRNA-dihydrouridine synthase